MLDTLRLEYNRIGRLEAIYASEEMHAYVREVYGLGVHFPQDAAQYCSCTSRYLDSYQTSTSPRGCLPSREQSWNWSRKEILRTGSDYTLWTKDLKQTLNRGKTVAPYNTRLSRLLPAAVGVICSWRLRSSGATLSQPDAAGLAIYNGTEKRVSPDIMILSLTYQLLSTKQARVVLNDDECFNQLKCSIKKARSAADTKNSNQRNQLISLYSIISNLFKKLSFSNAYLVLDRVDCMSFRDTVVGCLLDLMKSCPPGLKILVVGQAFDAPDGPIRDEAMI
ncbi:predicted protein [Histoplasma capsulatum H143]|uniref:Uncharacterized protein n=1 Tax=Ajellomyces capsulatus (strain H143) TaxID=544712 RepID=C6HN10_AJECH|nr:predicted protein [Histoplasma capsulatum H143]